MFQTRHDQTYFDDKFDSSVSKSAIPIRIAFLKKVYGILSVQLFAMVVMCSLIMGIEGIQLFFIRNQWLTLVLGLGTIGLVFGLHHKGKEYPTNFYLLGAFTVCESILVGSLVSFFDTALVIQALVLTAAIVVGLTVYTVTSKQDFSWLNATLYSGIMVLFFGGLIQLFLRSSIVHLGLTLGGAILFCLYIVYDTHLIMNKLNPEEYIVAVVTLYLDIVNLFIKILKLLRYLQENQQEQKNKRKK